MDLKELWNAWYHQFQEKFILENQTEDDDIQMLIMECYLYNLIQNCKLFFFLDYEKHEKKILSFFRIQILEKNVVLDLFSDFNLSNENLEIIDNFCQKKNTKDTIKSLHYLFLVLIEKDLFFQEVGEKLAAGSCDNHSKQIFELKKYLERKNPFFDYNTFDKKQEKYKKIQSMWKKKSKLTIITGGKTVEYTINTVSQSGDSSTLDLQVVNEKGEECSWFYVDRENNVQSCYGFMAQYDKISYFLESSFCLDKVTFVLDYFQFYIILFKSFSELFLFQTNFKNKDLLEIFRTEVQLILLKISIEKNILLGKENLENHQKLHLLSKKSKKHQEKAFLVQHDLNHYYLMDPSVNPLKNAHMIPKESLMYYFQNEIICCENEKTLWIKSKQRFYHPLRLQSVGKTAIQEYKQHVHYRQTNDKDSFFRGFRNCSLNHLCRKGQNHLEGFYETLVEKGLILLQYRNDKFVHHFQFPLCDFFMYKEEINVKNLHERYFFLLSKAKEKMISNVQQLKTRKKKTISLYDGNTISFQDNCYFWNQEIMSLEEIENVLTMSVKYYSNPLTVDSFFNLFQIEEELIESFLTFCYDNLHENTTEQESKKAFYDFLHSKSINGRLANNFHHLLENETYEEHMQKQKMLLEKMDRDDRILKKKQKIIQYFASGQISQDFTNNSNFNFSV